MASIEDLPIKSILEESTDEAIERLRQIRLARRTPVKIIKTYSNKSKASAAPKVSAEQAAKLLELLEGEL